MLLVAVITMLALSGCAREVDGRPAAGPRDVNPAYFFAGDVATYGQPVTPDGKVVLAYLRALRRIDVCGLVSPAKVGEVGSVSTLYAFNECDADVKVSGAAGRRFVTVEVVMTVVPGNVVAFRVHGAPVFEDTSDGCGYAIPLDLSRLPGAGPLRTPRQPFVRVGMLDDGDCGIAQRTANAIAERLQTTSLPVRDGAAVYPLVLAERDACEVLGALGADVDHWDVAIAQPHDCHFGFWRPASGARASIEVQLQPVLMDTLAEGRELQRRDGVEIYLDRSRCTAASIVGPPMQKRQIGGGFVDVANVVVRPAVVVAGNNCDAVIDIAVRAAKLYI
jgi:hypothetical protein